MPRVPVILTAIAVFVLLAACAPAAAPTPTPAPKETAKPVATAAPAASTAAAATKAPAAVVSSPTAKPTVGPLQKVKIQLTSVSASYLMLYVAKEKGLFQEEGIDPEFVILQSALAVPALLNNEIDYLVVLGSSMTAAFKGEPIKVVMGTKKTNTWHMFLRPGLTSGKDLDGQPVALDSREGTNAYAATAAIKHLGLDPTKNPIVIIPEYPNMLAALQTSAVGGASVSSPASVRAAAAGLKEVANTSDFLQVPQAITTNSKKLQDNPDQIKRVIRAILKGMAYTRDHKAEAIDIMVKQMSLEKELGDGVLAEELANWSFDGAVSQQGLETQLGILNAQADSGSAKATMDQVAKVVDFTLLKQAQSELGLAR